MLNKLLLILILLLAIAVRSVNWVNFTPGVYFDEASMAYDAYSLSIQGTDQWGKAWPVYFRSFATYQAPLYVYLSVIPVKLLGMSAFSIRLLSLIAGILTIVFTYLLIRLAYQKRGEGLALLGALILAVSPWHVLFSRLALEANLGLAIFIASLWLLFKGVMKSSKWMLLWGVVLLSITNYAYHSYRFTSVITLGLYGLFYFKSMSDGLKKVFVLGVLLFFVILIPELLILTTPGSLARVNSTQYSSESSFRANGGGFKSWPTGRYLFIGETFLGKYFDYLSPTSLFFDSDPSSIRSIPEMSSFYFWMVVFYFLGLWILVRSFKNREVLFFISIALLSIVAGAVTTDNLYIVRVMNYLVGVVVVIALGFRAALEKIKWKRARVALVVLMILASLANLYVNYFNFSPHEREADYSGNFNQMFQFSGDNPNSHFVVSVKEPFVYISLLYTYRYDPKQFVLSEHFDLANYYNDTVMPKTFELSNVSIRPVDWEKDPYVDQYLVGDEQLIPDYQAAQYGLVLIRRFKADLDFHYLTIYKTDPEKACRSISNPEERLSKGCPVKQPEVIQ